jgi:hypothetical protein
MNSYSRQVPNNKFWVLVLVAIIAGLATGFSVPLLASYRPKGVLEPQGMERNGETVMEILPAPAEPVRYDVERDSEVEALAARNRRLEVLVATLRREKAAEAERAEKNNRPLDELGPRQ